MRKIITCFLFLNAFMAFSADTMSRLDVNVDANAQSFTITLPANPTTGFQWTIKRYDKRVLKLTESQYMARNIKRIGAGGEMRFRFSRIKGASYPKSTHMLFRYARRWESGAGSIKPVDVHFIDPILAPQ